MNLRTVILKLIDVRAALLRIAASKDNAAGYKAMDALPHIAQAIANIQRDTLNGSTQ